MAGKGPAATFAGMNKIGPRPNSPAENNINNIDSDRVSLRRRLLRLQKVCSLKRKRDAEHVNRCSPYTLLSYII